MKFVLTAEHTYWTPVKVRIPNPDPKRAGQFIEQSFKVKFRAVPLDEARALAEEIAAIEDVGEAVLRQNDLLKTAVIGWDESIVGDDENPIPFDAAALEQVLSNVWALRGMWEAWRSSVNEDKARKGN